MHFINHENSLRKKADHLTITFREKDKFSRDGVLENGKVCLTFNPNGELTEIEIRESSKNGDLVLRYCNLPLNIEPHLVKAKNVTLDVKYIKVEIEDGRIISIPWDWYKDLREATMEQRLKYI